MSYTVKSYGNSEVPSNSPTEYDPFSSDAAYQSESMDEMNGYGEDDFYMVDDGYESDGEASTGSEPSDLKSYLADLKESIAADSKLDATAKAELLSEVSQAMLKVNQGKVGSERRRESLLAEAEAAIAEIEGTLAIQPALAEAHQQLSALRNSVEASDFPPEHQGAKSDLLKRLGKAESNLDLNPNQETVSKVNEALEEIESSLEETTGIIAEEADLALQDFEAKKNSLLTQIDGAKDLRQAEKEAFKAAVETKYLELKAQVKAGSLKAPDAVKQLEKIESDAGKIRQQRDLIEDIGDLPAKILKDSDDGETTQLAMKVKTALKTQDWNAVKSYLNERNNVDHMYGVYMIMQFVGTIYYGIAEEDGEKLNQYLNLIDPDVRKQMSRMTESLQREAPDFWNRGWFDDSHKREYLYYGPGDVTGDAIRDSLQYSEDQANEPISLESESSETSTTS